MKCQNCDFEIEGVATRLIVDGHYQQFCYLCGKLMKIKLTKKKCNKCGELLPLSKLFSYVDESNRAITKNSPEFCYKCYKETYGGN